MIGLFIDPGETSGFCVIEVISPTKINVLDAFSDGAGGRPPLNLQQRALALVGILRTFKPSVVGVEDYRIYPNVAKEHIGTRLWTPELIGCIEAVCGMMIPPVRVVRIQAAKKGRWPLARLNAKLPQFKQITSDHALDALRLGLAYLEARVLWSPS